MKEYYIENIKELMARCRDVDLLDLIYKILLDSVREGPAPSAPGQAVILEEMRWAA